MQMQWQCLIEAAGGWLSHLLAGFCIEQDPAQLNYLCRVFCNINAVLIAGCGYVDDDVAVEIGGLRTGRGLRGHVEQLAKGKVGVPNFILLARSCCWAETEEGAKDNGGGEGQGADVSGQVGSGT